MVYCFYIIIKKTRDFSWVYRHNNPQLIDQSERAHWFCYYINYSNICFIWAVWFLIKELKQGWWWCQGRCVVKKKLMLTSRICNYFDLFSTPMALKTWKISSRCSLSSDYTERRMAKKCTKIYNVRAQPLFCSLNLFLAGILVAVIVVVGLSSLLR